MLPIFESEFSNFNQPVAVKDIILEQNFFFLINCQLFCTAPFTESKKV